MKVIVDSLINKCAVLFSKDIKNGVSMSFNISVQEGNSSWSDPYGICTCDEKNRETWA